MAMTPPQKSKFFPKNFFLDYLRIFFRVSAIVLPLSLGSNEASAEAFSINDAISQAVHANPGVGEAAANRRATETKLYQTQGAYLPQVRLEAGAGPEKFNQAIVPPPLGNGEWLNGRQVSVVVRQILFDGIASIHEIWGQSERVDAAAFRVRERTELTALDAAEAYIDVVRFLRLVALANQNVANHEEIFSNVKSRFSGGRAGEGDLQQALERVEAAKAAREEFRRSLDDARSKYRKIIGLEAINLRFPAPLQALPRSKNEALTVALRYNPTLLAAESDREAARQAFHATDGAFIPTVSLVGRASRGIDADTFIGKRDDVSGKLVISWDIFRGGQDAWHRVETAERYTEETLRHARLQRDALESIDKAWAARTITADRIAALRRQLVAEKKTIAIYRKEYEIGRRKLIEPGCVVIGKSGFPVCEPAGSPLRTESPPSNTCVAAPPGAGMTTLGAEFTTTDGAGGLNICWDGAGPPKSAKEFPKPAPASSRASPESPGDNVPWGSDSIRPSSSGSMNGSLKWAPLARILSSSDEVD